MPPKVSADDNTVFLWRCLKASDYKTIDYDAVAAATGTKVGAVRMKFSRLKRKMETTIADAAAVSAPASTTAATTSSAGADQKGKKRKREDDEDEGEQDDAEMKGEGEQE